MENKKELYYYDISRFSMAANNYLLKHEQEKNKLCYAIERVFALSKRSIDKINNKIQRSILDISSKYATTDPVTKNFILDTDKDRSMTFTPENFRKKQEEINKLRDSYDEDTEENKLTIVTYFATEIPDDLTFEEKIAFSGIVIDPQMITE